MRVLFNELTDRYLLELNLPTDRVIGRPRYADEDIPWNDRLAQTFRERVRTAFLDAGRPQLHDVKLRVGVASPLRLGLLHVEKIVSDALVDVGVLRGDRIGDVRRIEVRRRLHHVHDDLQAVEVEAQSGMSIQREFYAIASERRPPTPAVDFAFDGMSEDPAAYARHLEQIAFDAQESDQLRLMSEMARRLEGSHSTDLGRYFWLTMRVSTYDRLVDLDNAGLFVLDLLTARLKELGLQTPLDQLVGRLHVTHVPGPGGYEARLSLMRHLVE